MDEFEKKLWEKSQKYIGFLRFVPFLRLVAVCNNLAFSKINKKSDIDLFIIARENRLFIVRLFLTFVLQILRVRRHRNKISGRFCLSFFVDDSFLDLSSIAIENDIYLAFWIKSMKPIIDDGISNDFLLKNLWACEYFENKNDFELDLSKKIKNKSFLKKFFEFILNRGFGDFLENKLKKWQINRAKKKALQADENSSLIINENILKFHNLDRRKEYRNKWVEKYGDLKINDERFLGIIE